MEPVGDKISRESLVVLYRERVAFISLARSFVRDSAVAEDLFQESLLYLMENSNRISNDNIKAYFYKVLMNKCLYYLRQTRRRAEIRGNILNDALLEESIKILSERVEEDAALSADIGGRIAECKQRLSPLAFDVFMASRIKGLTHKEIAGEMKISVRRVNTEIQKAMSVFMNVFEDYVPATEKLTPFPQASKG